MSDVGRKDDAGKTRVDLVPFEALEHVARVLGHGADKYDEHNWRSVPNWRSRYLAALLRHVSAYAQGQMTDAESGELHLSHACCCALFLIALEMKEAAR